MKCSIPEISWHNREPVLSLHIHPSTEGFYRLATGGADCHILIWQVIINRNGSVQLEALADLTRHQRAVNAVRWSPNGMYLASGDDDANIIIWQLKTDNIPPLDDDNNDKENWIIYKTLRGHKEDIYDLCWSPDSLKLLSGSIDNTAILWNVTKSVNESILSDHKGFVQGVAWDPQGHYISTISTDRICRIYGTNGKHVKCRIQKGVLSVPKDHNLYNKEVKYFHDDTFKSFFRRLDFSPDGTLLAVPSAKIELDECKTSLNGSLIFVVDSWNKPTVLPSRTQYSTVVKFCPVLFQIQKDGPDPIVPLEYRMVLAVATDHDVVLYDTQQKEPFAYLKDIHYTRLTDLAWSSDGLLLIAASTDGYCAVITFDVNELGIEYVKEENKIDESVLDVSGCECLDDVETTPKIKKLNILEKWTVKKPLKTTENDESESNTILEDTNKRKNDDQMCSTPKRIKPIRVLETSMVKESCKNSTDGKSRKKEKQSPLVSFLKKSSKEKSGNLESTTKENPAVPIIIIDENDARDAWKCGKEDTVVYQSNEPNECTEDFSLHLEDTRTEGGKESNVANVNQTVETVPEEISSPTSKSKKEETITLNKENLESTDLTKNVVKRRVPFVTLSSPKRK